MRMARRLIGTLGGTAGAVGLLLCIAGIVGCWWLRAEATRRAHRALGHAEELLVEVRDSLGQIGVRLRQTHQELDSIRHREADLAAHPPAERSTRKALSRKAIAAVSPQLGEARGQLAKAIEVGLVLNGLLDALAELPLVERTGVDTDRLKQSSAQLSELIEKADKLAGSLGRSAAEQPDATTTEESTRLAGSVGRLMAAMDEGSSRANEAREKIADRHARIVHWVSAAAVALTVILVWIGLGQFSLLVQGWNFVRKSAQPD
jgi:hypothetical protein